MAIAADDVHIATWRETPETLDGVSRPRVDVRQAGGSSLTVVHGQDYTRPSAIRRQGSLDAIRRHKATLVLQYRLARAERHFGRGTSTLSENKRSTHVSSRGVSTVVRVRYFTTRPAHRAAYPALEAQMRSRVLARHLDQIRR